jgi:hypothetical protein
VFESAEVVPFRSVQESVAAHFSTWPYDAQTGQVEFRPKSLLRLADYTLKWISVTGVSRE